MNVFFKKNIILPDYNKYGTFIRKNRSFVLRKKKLTELQKYAIEKYWSTVVINFEKKKLQFNKIFDNLYPIIIDIGFGTGTSLINVSKKKFELNLLGIEVYLPGIANCLKKIHFSKIENLKIIYHDAVEVMWHMIPNNSIYKIHIFFPDPWHKTKHHKRRMLTHSFIKLISKKLIDNGVLHIKTDCKLYILHIIKIIKQIKVLHQIKELDYFLNKENINICTKFEKKGIFLGRPIVNLIFIKKNNILSKNF